MDGFQAVYTIRGHSILYRFCSENIQWMDGSGTVQQSIIARRPLWSAVAPPQNAALSTELGNIYMYLAVDS